MIQDTVPSHQYTNECYYLLDFPAVLRLASKLIHLRRQLELARNVFPKSREHAGTPSSNRPHFRPASMIFFRTCSLFLYVLPTSSGLCTQQIADANQSRNFLSTVAIHQRAIPVHNQLYRRIAEPQEGACLRNNFVCRRCTILRVFDILCRKSRHTRSKDPHATADNLAECIAFLAPVSRPIRIDRR